jgi:hypothetical protein
VEKVITSLDRLLIPGDLLMTVSATTRGQALLVDHAARLHYETAGSGSTPIVFVSGDVPASRVFRPQLTHFDASTAARAPRARSAIAGPIDRTTGRRPPGGVQDLDDRAPPRFA